MEGRPDAPPGSALATIVHLADLHLCDAQSPGRAEFLDRYADPDQPAELKVDAVGTYRAHELLTTQTAVAMVEALNAVSNGPVTGGSVDFTVVTGDATDNGQHNELDWYLAVLDGGALRPDSGDPDRYEGVADDVEFDERYWHPESDQEDLPRARYGFPDVPGLLGAARRGYESPGLRVPWLAVNGNHDLLVQGTMPAAPTGDWLTGSRKPIAVPAEWSAEQQLALLAGLEASAPDAVALTSGVVMREVTPDPRRAPTSIPEFVAAHLTPHARPAGHGFSPADAGLGRAYYRYDHGSLSVLTLDTVNPHGYWEGSLDPGQLRWLAEQLTSADGEHRYVVLASHHPLARLTNGRTDGSERRVLGEETAALVGQHPSVVLWLNGHTHTNVITPHGGTHGWWEVTAPAVVDFPQQARILEVSRSLGSLLRIDVTNVDHLGPAPWGGGLDSVTELAGLSRELSANDWQTRAYDLDDLPRRGAPADRNTTLWLTDPFAT